MLACAGDDGVPDGIRRALLVGIDGASWEVAGPLLERGELPNLAAIAAGGRSGTLHPRGALKSPRIWNSIATGKLPREHGIEDFVRAERDGSRRLYLSSDRRVRALWNIASEAGLRVAVVNWWNTHPPERVNGAMVSDHFFGRVARELQRRAGARAEIDDAGTIHPEELRSKLHRAAERPDPPAGVRNPLANARLPSWMDRERLATRFDRDAALVRMALELETELRPDLLLLLLPGLDRVSHALWIGMASNPPYPERLHLDADQRAAVRAALEASYRATDALLGALVKRFDADDLVLVLSDHGFEAGSEGERMTGVHRSHAAREGVFFLRGPGIAARPEHARLDMLDVTPTLLAWLGLPVARDMPGRVRFLSGEAPARVATHEGPPIEPAQPGAEARDDALLEELRELGYIE